MLLPVTTKVMVIRLRFLLASAALSAIWARPERLSADVFRYIK